MHPPSSFIILYDILNLSKVINEAHLVTEKFYLYGKLLHRKMCYYYSCIHYASWKPVFLGHKGKLHRKKERILGCVKVT